MTNIFAEIHADVLSSSEEESSDECDDKHNDK